MDPDKKKGLLLMNSQVIGVLAAAAQGNDDAENLQTGAWVAGNATKYNHYELPAGLTQYGQAATSLGQQMQEQGVSQTEISNALQAMARGEGFEGPQPAKALLQAWAAAMLAGGSMVAPTAGAADVGVGAVIGGGANISCQLSSEMKSLNLSQLESALKSLSYTDATIATVVGGLTQGKGFLASEMINVGSAYIGSHIKGTDATSAMIGAGVGTAAGTVAGKVVGGALPSSASDLTKEASGAITGSIVSENVSSMVSKE